ncbi:sensor histidine kinase [Pedobacter duraquae]|uniref:histidine kinase n=1 Tax=Pedobacter duraquae TaxID=425511 RepID=A0A4R6IK82_9SPHI|nr:ATP-binding protein [Pedobacter duraquae]TDO22474.1 histidine kinase/DNA gyrase B/HSP90-like ATPase [Pedobacter duraquae]
MQTVTIDWLKKIEVLQDIPDAQLQWFIDMSEDRSFADGDYVLEPGQALTGPHILLEGKMRFFVMQSGSMREYLIFEPGAITGYLPFSRAKISSSYVQAIGELRMLMFPTAHIHDMITQNFELTQALVHIMSNRVREFANFQQQGEKMMALGKLSAGLAHELNNPASAIVRDSSTLIKHVQLSPEVFKDRFSIKLSPETVDTLSDTFFAIISKERPLAPGLKQRTALEDKLGDWLDDNDIDHAWEIAENFVDYNFSIDNLDALAAIIPEAYRSPLFNWMATKLCAEKMMGDIRESARRIAELVNSVKNFTHMDQGQDKQYADIHKGIANTLTMLGYKIRKGNIEIVQDYDLSLPPVNAVIGELNQVWTNLIDNALDAMEPTKKGVLTIRTKKDGEFVEVTITDNGPGIPAEVQSKVFDPFFTTKEMGKGTGMGLEVVHRIVDQHKGTVKLKSKPGETAFVVCFPING